MLEDKLKNIKLFKLNSKASPFEIWVKSLPLMTRVAVYDYIQRIARGGGLKNIKHLGDNVSEIKINKGPSYRVYFGIIENITILLLLGGIKSSQKRDIKKAKKYWRIHNEQNRRF